jgi:hypothetical protein
LVASGASPAVTSLALGTNVLYAGGQFAAASGQPQSNLVSFVTGPVGVPWVAEANDLSLDPMVPTPTYSVATVRFRMPRPGSVTMALYDLTGRRVALLLDRAPRPAGQQELRLDTRSLRAGCYFCRLEVGTAKLTQRLIVVR